MPADNQKECCPVFDPTPWDNKTFKWDNKKFIKDHVFTLFFMPMNFGQVMTRLMKKVEASAVKTDYVCLSDHTSKWNMDIYVSVDKEVAGAENVTLSGNYYSRVYEGEFKETGKWCQDFAEQAKAKGLTVKKLYMWYTTCPKCAKKHGHNYVVVVARVG
jgi:hypothetical protein